VQNEVLRSLILYSHIDGFTASHIENQDIEIWNSQNLRAERVRHHTKAKSNLLLFINILVIQ